MREFFKGWLWHGGRFHTTPPEGLFPPDCSPELFRRAIAECDGCFCLILDRGEHVYAAVDRVRSHPLFYAESGNDLLLGPDAAELRSSLGCREPYPDAVAEFLLTGYTTRDTTLFAGLKQLEAGQFLVWSKTTATLEIADYYLYRHLFEPLESPLEEMDAMHERVIGRLIESAGGRTLAIPLSGGYDSRLIAFMLKRLGYENVVCFTYGSPHQGEAEASRKVARFLNYPWFMLHHTRRMWFEAYRSPAMKDYFRFAGQSSSSPHIQDWLAVKLLKERGLVPPDAIFVPGHSGGCPQGANLPNLFGDRDELVARDLLDSIFSKHYALWQTSAAYREERFEPMLSGYLGIPPVLQPEFAASLFDEWDWRQRQAKFIVNSVRVYEFFGFEWRIPLWDMDFMEFWRRVPLCQRLERSLYRQYAHRYQAIRLPAYHNYSWPVRLRHKMQNLQRGNLYDLRYGRYLDSRDRDAYASTPVQSLLDRNFTYPKYIDTDRPLLKTDLNAIQSLDYLRGLLDGEF